MLDARSETFGLAARSRGAGSALRLLLSSRCTAETESRNAEGVARSALVLDAGDRCGTHDVGCLNRPISRVADCLDLAGTVQLVTRRAPSTQNEPLAHQSAHVTHPRTTAMRAKVGANFDLSRQSSKSALDGRVCLCRYRPSGGSRAHRTAERRTNADMCVRPRSELDTALGFHTRRVRVLDLPHLGDGIRERNQ